MSRLLQKVFTTLNSFCFPLVFHTVIFSTLLHPIEQLISANGKYSNYEKIPLTPHFKNC